MDQERVYQVKLRQFVDSIVRKGRYIPEYQYFTFFTLRKYIADEVYNFLNNYRHFQCKLAHTNTPGSLQSFPVLELKGSCMHFLNHR